VEFPHGKLTFLTGPNGVGKTVLAKCLTGLLPFDDGEIKVDGRAYTELTREATRGLGIDYIPQRLERPSNTNCHEFISLNLRGRGIFYSKQRVTSLVNEIEAEYDISFGMSLCKEVDSLALPDVQKLYLLTSLCGGGVFLILDEPTAYLQRTELREFESLLRRLVDAEKTILVIAHPEHFSIQADNVLYFDREGVGDQRVSGGRVHVTSPDKRIRRKKDVQVTIKGIDEPLKSGQVLVIEGPSSQEFFDFADQIGQCHKDLVSFPSNQPPPVWEYVPFDATSRCVAQELTVLENSLVNHWSDPEIVYFGGMLLSRKRAGDFLASAIIRDFDIDPDNPDIRALTLSGGNLQRLVVGRALMGFADVLVAGEIFRGLDDEGISLAVRRLEMELSEGLIAILLSTSLGTELAMADKKYRYRPIAIGG